uniref:Uncharacterized protein n=1 Tax=Panagrolaimus davidi TaxID=227884 RepID=A0A914PQ92_9BILA
MKNWETTAVCLEREFHNTSLIESNGMDCCWLLYDQQCREQCSKFMRTPTMSIEEKVMFEHPCMNQFNQEVKDSCLEDSWKRLHLCFPQCIALTTLKSKQEQKFVFNPREHCSFFKQKDSRKPCIGSTV